MSNQPTRDQLAYEKPEFLNSQEGRSVRILSEYLDPLREFRLHHIHDTLVFFGSARIPSPEDASFAGHPMRKFWFAYLAKALVVFPGGFGTLDELSEILTLAQTRKLHKRMVCLLYGTAFWKKIINFDALVETGMIGIEDLELFEFADDVDTAFAILKDGLTNLYLNPEVPLPEAEINTPAIASSRV